MKPQRFNEQFAGIYDLAVRLADVTEADGLLVLLDGPSNWEELRRRGGEKKILVVADATDELDGAETHGLAPVVLDVPHMPVFDKLAQALLESVALELLARGSTVVAVYSAFDAGKIDSLSFIRLDEHLGRLTVRDLRQLKTIVPLDTLKTVVDLAVDIGREGREGKAVGTLFVVGDSRKALTLSHAAVWDPVKGYSRKDRNLRDRRVREQIKEIAQMDGAFIVAADGTLEAACRILDSPPVELTISQGLGSRHWAAAAISKHTKAVAIAVSESNGTVRIFQNGEVVLRIEPLRHALKFKEFDFESPPEDA